jgi:thiamine biosynthesis lipoprotein
MMGTFIEIQVDFDQEQKRSHQHHIISSAFREIARVEYLMTTFENHSDISIINQTVNTRNFPRIEIHPMTYEVLQLAKKIYEITKGAFDCGVGHILGQLGIRPQMKEFDLLLSDYSIENIELEENFGVRIHKPVLLDLGGIAKGYAVDRAIQVIKSFGINKAVVNAGGILGSWVRYLRKF